jgi:CheY-like chemotaxis protein
VDLGALYVRAHRDAQPGSYVLLSVTDTGCGMDEATKAHIFEPFFTTKEEGKGTGLGLATVHGIVKQSGGHIEVYSEPGRGTTFKIYLPVAEAPVPSGEPGAQGYQLPRGTETVLLVEDAEDLRALARLVLQGVGYTVLDARNGTEALRLWDRHAESIHLLIADVVMPQMSGRELAAHLEARGAALKILYISGYTDDAVVRHGVLEKDVQFLQKPFTPLTLARKVREVLNQPTGQRRSYPGVPRPDPQPPQEQGDLDHDGTHPVRR